MMKRLLAVGALLAIIAMGHATSASADDATPVIEDVDIYVGFIYCHGSSTPGVTDWLAFADFDEASTSTCNVVFDETVDPAQTVSVYDAATNVLVDTTPFSSVTTNRVTLPPGDYYFVESANGGTSPVYTIYPGEYFSIYALAHINDPLPTPVATGTVSNYAIQSMICTPADSSESLKLLVTSLQQLMEPSSESVTTSDSAPFLIGCSYDTQPDDISSIGSFYVESTGWTTSAEGSFGPYTDSRVFLDDFPIGEYTIRFVRTTGEVQISDPFFITGENDNGLSLFIYTEYVAPITPTSTATVTATATSEIPTPVATTAVTMLPSTGSGSSDSNSWLLILGSAVVIGIGVAARVMRSSVGKH